jgi:hypothetical protein
MRNAIMLTTALLLAAGLGSPSLAQNANDLVSQSVAAQGGADALRAFKSAVIKGDAKHWEPGQSFKAGGEARFLGDSKFTLTADGAERVARIDWDRDMKYPAVERIQYSEIITPNYGVAIDGKGTQTPMSGIRLAAEQRELARQTPLLVLRAMESPQNVKPIEDQKLGDQSLPAASFNYNGTTYIMLFDRTTKLPAAVRTRDDDHIYGDSNYDMVLADWRDVGGIKLAHSLTFKLNGMDVQQLTYREVTPNPTIAPDTFKVSDEVQAKARAAASDAPYQWVLRRMFLGRFLDSDQVIAPAGGSLKVVELSPNVQQVVGGSANNLIVAMKDGIAVFDAPVSDVQSRFVIDAAKAKYPGKPIKYLILTHHHMDHTGGMRAYVAEGASVIVPEQVKAYFEQVANTPHTFVPDALARQAKAATITGVKDELSLKDDSTEIRLYNISNPHVDGMLIGHIVKDNIVWVTDIWSPGRDNNRTAGIAAFNDAVKKIGIKDATFAGGHGSTAKQSVLDGIMAQN